MKNINTLLETITSERKWYAVSAEESEQTRLRVTAHRIRKGKCTLETLVAFFKTFGYNITVDVFKKQMS